MTPLYYGSLDFGTDSWPAEAVGLALVEWGIAENDPLVFVGCEDSGSGTLVVSVEDYAILNTAPIADLCTDPPAGCAVLWVNTATLSVKSALTQSGTLRKS